MVLLNWKCGNRICKWTSDTTTVGEITELSQKLKTAVGHNKLRQKKKNWKGYVPNSSKKGVSGLEKAK